MDKVMWKVSGLVFVTSSLVGLIGGLLAAPQSGVRTRKKIHRGYEHMKDQVKQEVYDLKGSVANVAKQGDAYGKNCCPGKDYQNGNRGFWNFLESLQQRLFVGIPRTFINTPYGVTTCLLKTYLVRVFILGFSGAPG